jgi:hypothetical protein
MSQESITEADKATAVKTRRVILVLLIILAIFTAFLAVVWNRTGQWTPRWSADEGAVCPLQIMAPASPQDTKVNVYNGTSREGEAAEVAKTLDDRGYQVGRVGNGQAQAGQKSGSALVVTGPKTVAQALSVQRQVPGSRVVIQPRRWDGQVDLLLTEGFWSLSPDTNLGPGRVQCTQLVYSG